MKKKFFQEGNNKKEEGKRRCDLFLESFSNEMSDKKLLLIFKILVFAAFGVIIFVISKFIWLLHSYHLKGGLKNDETTVW